MFSTEEKREEVQKIIDNTRNWISTHGPGGKVPWPQHECDIKSRRLEIMKAIRDDLDLAVERRRS